MNSKDTTWIVCRNSKIKGMVDFYMLLNGHTYYLFSQKFRNSSWSFFKDGVLFKTVLDYSKAKHDDSVINVMQRLRRHITYLLKTEEMMIPEINKKMLLKEEYCYNCGRRKKWKYY